MAEEIVSTQTESVDTTSTATEPVVPETSQETSEPAPAVDIEKLIQQAVDRATNRLGNENKKLRGQVEALKKEKLTDEEVKQLELAEKEADIADREAKLAEQENRMAALKAIKDAGLDDGGKNALELVDFVMADSEEAIRAKVKTFNDLVKKLVAAQVDQTFKAKGRNPEKSGTGEGATTNPVIARIGQQAAERSQASTDIRNRYLGGK